MSLRAREGNAARRDAPFDAVLATPFGRLGIRTMADALAEISFLPDAVR